MADVRKIDAALERVAEDVRKNGPGDGRFRQPTNGPAVFNGECAEQERVDRGWSVDDMERAGWLLEANRSVWSRRPQQQE